MGARCGLFALRGQNRIFQEALDLGLLGEGLAQEGFVGRVLEQAAHQIGHARQQVAVGGIEAHALGHVQKAFAHGLGHAVEHLEFITLFGHVQFACAVSMTAAMVRMLCEAQPKWQMSWFSRMTRAWRSKAASLSALTVQTGMSQPFCLAMTVSESQ